MKKVIGIIIILLIVLNTITVYCPGYTYYPDIAIEFSFEKEYPKWKLSRKRLTDQRDRNW